MEIRTLMTIIQPGKAPRVYDLKSFNKNVLYLGRGAIHGGHGASPNDIVIDDDVAYVSRAQCTLNFYDGRWFLQDDGSTNGMWYQGRRTASLEINDGDKVYVGNTSSNCMVLMFSCRQEQSAPEIESYSLQGKRQFTIGRDSGCDIVIRNPTVSRLHCIITCDGGAYYIADNNSTNGLLLNGRLLDKKERLNQMDKITIADITLFFSDGALYLNRPEGGVSVVAEHVYRMVGKGQEKKCITNDVSLTIKPNEFVAIIGGSGAGKTTILNCLSGMTGFTSGEIYINGESIRSAGKSIRSIMGYVPQQDIVYDTLTLERMLYYSALLRMPKDTSKEEIQAKIEETLEIVELSEHRKTFISKLSGGQRKRASIAVELLASPKLFFLDEPSSGLDPGTEKNLMRMLRRLSESGKTVIMVTHTIQNIDLCDRLICMGKGGLLCYSGPPSEAAEFLGKERLTDIYDVLNESPEEPAERFKKNYTRQVKQETKSDAPTEAKTQRKGPAVLFRQFRVMAMRYAEIMKNSLGRLLLLMLMPIILAILVCLAYQADGGLFDLLGINISRQNFAFFVAKDTMSLISAFSCAAFWAGIFNSVQEISKERTIFHREKFTGVAVAPYLMSKFSILTTLCAVQALAMTAILWWLGNTVATMDAGKHPITNFDIKIPTEYGLFFTGNAFFLEMFITTFLCVLSAMCLGLAISSMVNNDMALVICPICLLPQLLFSGVATPLSGMTKTLSNIVCCRWSCIAFLTSVDVNKMKLSCEYDNRWIIEDNPAIVSADYSADKTYLFGLNPVASAWVALLLISFACLAFAYFVLRYRDSKSR